MFSLNFIRRVYTQARQIKMDVTKEITDLQSLAKAIIGGSNVFGEDNSKLLCSKYSALGQNAKFEFLQHLAKTYHTDNGQLDAAIQNYKNNRDQSLAFRCRAEEKLRSVLNPKYTGLFHLIGRLEGGVKFLVDLRDDVLELLPQVNPESETVDFLRTMNITLKDLLTLWFAVGFLKIERITWSSSCQMLQKVSEYEAVHPVRNWTDLKRRVGPYRRCYVFTHNCMPGEPIVVLHTALTSEIPSSIQSIIAHAKQYNSDSYNASQNGEDPVVIKAAIFYSISSTQKGLQGIELGTHLIKRVVKEVQLEYPNIRQFSTLSPIPHFREWLVSEINHVLKGDHTDIHLFTKEELDVMKEHFKGAEPLSRFLQLLKVNAWFQDDELIALLKTPLTRICAHYLYREKHRGFALDSVAHFHLKNGAVMWRLNWLGDTSPRGLTNSCSLMLNYRYFLEDMENNSKHYLEQHTVPASDKFLQLLKPTHSSL